MSANVYNIIWADDEYQSLKNDHEIRKFLDVYNVEVLVWVPTSMSLKNALDHYKDKVDAVIIDGNFAKSEVDYVEPDDISGLIDTLTFIELFNVKRDIPFFLYTSKKVFLQEICKNGELDYFLSTERLIQKGEIETLTKKIILDVDHIHSIEHMVNTKYFSLFKIAKGVDEQSAENLHQFLLDEARDKKFDKSIDLFNQLRGIMEQIMERCKENGIIPQEVQSLNNFKNFYTYISYYDSQTKSTKSYWYGLKVHGRKLKPHNGIMPIPIGYSFDKLIDIIQDGSHKIQNLNLHVSEYVQEAESPFLFRSCLYQVMDVIRWYGDIMEKLKNGSVNANKLYFSE